MTANELLEILEESDGAQQIDYDLHMAELILNEFNDGFCGTLENILEGIEYGDCWFAIIYEKMTTEKSEIAVLSSILEVPLRMYEDIWGDGAYKDFIERHKGAFEMYIEERKIDIKDLKDIEYEDEADLGATEEFFSNPYFWVNDLIYDEVYEMLEYIFEYYTDSYATKKNDNEIAFILKNPQFEFDY